MIPGNVVSLVQATAQAILKGERDPLSVIRSHMVKTAKWEVKSEGSSDDGDVGDEDYEPSEDDLEDATDAFGELDDELESMGYEND